MAHIHEIKDAETHFIIDATTREISNAGVLPSLVQGDHNSEVFTFVAPRFVDNHDLSTCNKVKVHYLNIDSITRKPYADIYEVDDLHIDEIDKTKVVFTWLISRYSTQNVGLLNFAIEYTCEKDGVVDYSWNTAIFTGINVKAGINNAAQIMTEYTDILEKWKQDVIKELTQNNNSHDHDNKNTLDAFSCDALDNPITGGDFNFGINNEDWNRLKFQGDTLLCGSDGAVVSKGEEVEINGQKYFRLYFNQPGLVTTESVPSFVDIPVTDVEDKFDIGFNGVGLVLPTGGEGSGHTHNNKDILDAIEVDDIGTPMIGGDKVITTANAYAELVDNLDFSSVDDILADRIESAETDIEIEPNTDYVFGESETLIINLANGDQNKRNEYMFSFTSGATPTVLTLPDTVKWANELTIEANKRYEISIVDNIGLWCAVEVSG